MGERGRGESRFQRDLCMHRDGQGRRRSSHRVETPWSDTAGGQLDSGLGLGETLTTDGDLGGGSSAHGTHPKNVEQAREPAFGKACEVCSYLGVSCSFVYLNTRMTC